MHWGSLGGDNFVCGRACHYLPQRFLTWEQRVPLPIRVERRLAAILAVDVAGYSRLMGEDEEGTLAALRAVRRELGDPKIAEHSGRIVKTTGDGLLVEFASVVDAVRCAGAGRDLNLAEVDRLRFRIGVNLGDVIVDGGDI